MISFSWTGFKPPCSKAANSFDAAAALRGRKIPLHVCPTESVALRLKNAARFFLGFFAVRSPQGFFHRSRVGCSRGSGRHVTRDIRKVSIADRGRVTAYATALEGSRGRWSRSRAGPLNIVNVDIRVDVRHAIPRNSGGRFYADGSIKNSYVLGFLKCLDRGFPFCRTDLGLCAAAVLLFAFIPVLQAMGLGRWMLAGRWFAKTPVSSTLLYFVVYWTAVYGVVIWPLSTLKRRNNFMAALMSLLAALPLLSFAAWQGQARAWWEIADSAVLVLPAAWCAVQCSIRQRHHFIASFFLAVVTFLPIFVVNDILAPFPVLFGFSAKVAEFSMWARAFRIVGGISCLAIPFFWAWDRETSLEREHFPREFLSTLDPQKSH